MQHKKVSILLLFFFSLTVNAQSQGGLFEQLESYKVQPIIGIQMWGMYTFNEQIYNETTQRYEKVDDRFTAQLRRSRLGVKGQPYKNIKFNFTTALDLLGNDILSATQGGGNNGGSPIFRIWNAYVQWRVLNNRESFHMTIGFMPPQIGRESITGALNSTSMEKSWSQNYLRQHLVGTGPGRAFGINVGGLLYKRERTVNLSYDLGLFNPVFHSYGGNSTGKEYALLLTGRLVLHVGDPEFSTYTTSHKVNYFGQRNGISIALAGGSQGKTDLFVSNQALGFDFLLNWKGINLDGEWTFMERGGSRMVGASENNYIGESNTGYVRLGYNLPLPNGRNLEPVIMLMQFNGALDELGQDDAALLNSFSGEEQLIDIGLNYYLNTSFKLTLHYSFQQANSGAAGDGATVNHYFFQGGVGAIHRGNWFGLGLVAAF